MVSTSSSCLVAVSRNVPVCVRGACQSCDVNKEEGGREDTRTGEGKEFMVCASRLQRIDLYGGFPRHEGVLMTSHKLATAGGGPAEEGKMRREGYRDQPRRERG